MYVLQTVEVETHGKGKAYTRIEPVVTTLSWAAFWTKFGVLVNEFSQHIVTAWFLTNTKVEMIRPLERRSLALFFTTDFAENILVVRKHELADQYFHRIEILLFGAVVCFVEKIPDGEDGGSKKSADQDVIGAAIGSQAGDQESTSENSNLTLHQRSYMVSSDYRYLCTENYVPSISNPRVKDCTLVYVAFRLCVLRALQVAATMGLRICRIIHKVSFGYDIHLASNTKYALMVTISVII